MHAEDSNHTSSDACTRMVLDVNRLKRHGSKHPMIRTHYCRVIEITWWWFLVHGGGTESRSKGVVGERQCHHKHVYLLFATYSVLDKIAFDADAYSKLSSSRDFNI